MTSVFIHVYVNLCTIILPDMKQLETLVTNHLNVYLSQMKTRGIRLQNVTLDYICIHYHMWFQADFYNLLMQ